ncbi:MAG: glycosyltransferase family 2 protein [Candidatus Omnitrophota bacterium]
MISIVIPVYNGQKHLEDCLKHIFISTYKDYEIIIVDDCSSDASSQIADKGRFYRDVPFFIIRLGQRQGPAAARNIASQNARGEILLFIDADIFIAPDTMQRVADFLGASNGADAITGLYSVQPAYTNFSSRYKNLYLRYKFANAAEFTCTANTALLAVRKVSFEKTGGFNPDMLTCEDFEFSQRFAAAGFNIYNDKGLEVVHSRYFSLPGLISDDFIKAVNMAHLFLNRRGAIRRHPGEKGILSISRSQMFATVATFLLFIDLCLLPFFPSVGFVAIGVVLAAITAISNFDFWRFQWKGQKPVFKILSFLFTYIEHLISAFGVITAVARRIVGIKKGNFPFLLA